MDHVLDIDYLQRTIRLPKRVIVGDPWIGRLRLYEHRVVFHVRVEV